MHAISTALDIQVITSIEDIQASTGQGSHLQRLKPEIMKGWLHSKVEVQHRIQKYWPLRHELVMIDGIAMKGKQIIIPSILRN